jgi:hypothetical protein
VLDDVPTTTNTVEAWHASVNAKTKVPHPNICKCIDMRMSEINKTNLMINDLRTKKGKLTKV